MTPRVLMVLAVPWVGTHGAMDAEFVLAGLAARRLQGLPHANNPTNEHTIDPIGAAAP